MAEAGLVSVVLASYNGGSRIAAAIESVLSQTYAHWELIVAIDGSSDDTSAVVGGFEDARISMVTLPENQGVAAARNAAIAVSKGEYVAFVDDDDWWAPEKLAWQVAMLEADLDLGLVHGGVIDVMEDARQLTRMPPRDANSYRANLVRDCIATSTVVVRHSVLSRLGMFDPALMAFEDWELWTRVLRVYPGAFVPRVVARVSERRGSLMHGSTTRLSRARAEVVRRRWQVLRMHKLRRRALAYHDYFVGGLLLVEGRRLEARRRARRSLRLRLTVRAGLLYVISFADSGVTSATWRQLQRLRRLVRA